MGGARVAKGGRERMATVGQSRAAWGIANGVASFFLKGQGINILDW